MKHLESQLQTTCVNYFRIRYPNEVIFAIPNGGNRSSITGAILKREGVMAGVADLFIMAARAEYHGLFVEIKLPKGRVQESQQHFENLCILHGYGYRIARSIDEFMGCVDSYMRLQ